MRVAAVGFFSVRGFPAGDGVIVGDHARAGLQEFFQTGPEFLIERRRQVDDHYVGAGEIGFEQIAFNYVGRAEIVDAVKAIVASGVSASKIDERTIHRHLYSHDLPDPDLVIRTSGEFRVSNFLLWELAYSELVFTDVLWPDFRRHHLLEAVREFQARDRRYGTTGQREEGIPS